MSKHINYLVYDKYPKTNIMGKTNINCDCFIVCKSPSYEKPSKHQKWCVVYHCANMVYYHGFFASKDCAVECAKFACDKLNNDDTNVVFVDGNSIIRIGR